MSGKESYDIDEIRKMISAIRTDDHNVRLNALSNLHLIAKVLGPERTRTELIPYTIETTDHNPHDLSIIGEELGKLLNDVGGPSHIKILLEALRTLCENEDILIREPATDSIVKLGKLLTKSEYGVITQFAKDLCEDTWYPLRCSGACVCCELYHYFPDSVLKEIDQELASLAGDQMVMVRRSLAKSIPSLIKSERNSVQLASNIIKALSSDESAAVAIEIPISISLLASSAPDVALSVSEKIYKSDIWQAKSVLISYLDRIFKNNPPKEFLKQVVNSSLIDGANVIRASIARQIPFIYESKCLSFDEFQQFVMSLISDSESCVRLAVASSLGKMPSTKKGNFDESSITTLLNDEELDVRMEALSSVAISGKAISSASKNLTDLIKFSNWRIKKGVADLLPKISNIFDEKRFNNEMVPIVKSLLSDEASEVRQEIARILVSLVKKYGEKWEKTILFPILQELFESPDYMLRKTGIEAVSAISCFDQFKDTLEKLCSDPCPNVRMVLARNLPRNSSLLDKLKKDEDIDVKDAANKH
ncbi:HEAT repeat family protein [Tritrichomonas foetus]|uniref:HEAT repeat family protein n=1 Tax=Tritrichomonas foetus TaxID=1144522 RepID=A0A1J4JD67_9EUKA|nr:HEAT repeat family protein [Tritrichomonas foetus]|eukprot:OHS97142.1 HEAT repeat family protein [Tritrichomonas foetus]